MNPDLQKERNSATFHPDELTHLLDGSESVTKRRRYIENLASQEDAFKDTLGLCFMTIEEHYNDGIKRSAKCAQNIRRLGLRDKHDLRFYQMVAFPSIFAAFHAHQLLFTPMLENLASEEQRARWLPRCFAHEIIGAYAQTELGHGSHVRGLETTATYDRETEEFVIHSPNNTATKWWAGGRVTVGDMGPKFGFYAMDNGFLKFDHLRIPRENMAMGYEEVLKDGTYKSKAGHSKLTYLSMLTSRVDIVKEATANYLAQAVTIATRYSAVRRQSEIQPGAPEPQVLDFQTQQHKLFPWVATAYAGIFSGNQIELFHDQIIIEVNKGNVKSLPELHALSSGLKAFSTYYTMFGIEECRLACGGLGYSLASGLPRLYSYAAPATTVEGENTVMYLQCARFLLKSYKRASAGQILTGSVAYLSDKALDKCVIGEDCSLETLVAAYNFRALRLVHKASRRLDQLIKSGRQPHEATNLTGEMLTKAAEAHCHLYTVRSFVNVVQHIQKNTSAKDVLKQLCTLYALHGISTNSADFLEDGFMTPEQLSFVEQKGLALLAEIRPNAVALVDAFDFKDQVLGSVLGRYDGQVYPNLYEWVKREPLNKTDVHDSYYKYMQPLKKSQL